AASSGTASPVDVEVGVGGRLRFQNLFNQKGCEAEAVATGDVGVVLGGPKAIHLVAVDQDVLPGVFGQHLRQLPPERFQLVIADHASPPPGICGYRRHAPVAPSYSFYCNGSFWGGILTACRSPVQDWFGRGTDVAYLAAGAPRGPGPAR